PSIHPPPPQISLFPYTTLFRSLDKVYYSSKLFGPFARRIPDSRRPDYKVVLQNLGLSPNSSDMDILLASGGILATDDYEFVAPRSEEHTSELQSRFDLVCRLLL